MMQQTHESTRVTRRHMLLGGVGAALLSGTTAVGVVMRGGVLRVAAPSNPSTLDPMTGRSGTDHVQLFTIYDTLVEWDYDTLKAKPGLARSWYTPDPLSLVLTLQDGVSFHDGTPFDAAAVKFNLERAMTDARSNIKADLASVARVAATDPATVTIHLKMPDTALPLILSDRAGMMVSPKAATTGKLDRSPVGTGPWKFESWSDGSSVFVTRNNAYWKPGLPYLNRIEFRFITDTNAGLRSIVSGENDLAYGLSARQTPVANRDARLVSVRSSTIFVQMFYLNMGRPPLDDVRVRQAINLAVDRRALNQVTQLNLAEIATTALPKEHWGHDPSLDDAYPHDPVAARKLLAEAGHGDGLTVKVIGWSDQNSQQRLELLAEQMRQVGIRLDIQLGSLIETGEWFYGPDKRGDMFLAGWSGRPDPSLTLALLFAKESFYNAGHAEPDGFADALAKTRLVDGQQERKAALASVQRIVADNALFVPTVFEPGLAVHSRKVNGFRLNLLGKPKFTEVSLAPD